MESLLNKGLNKYIGGLTSDKDEVDNYTTINEYLSYIIILNIDIFRTLIILKVFRENKINLIIIK